MKEKPGRLPIFQQENGELYRLFPSGTTLILMGDWCSEG